MKWKIKETSKKKEVGWKIIIECTFIDLKDKIKVFRAQLPKLKQTNRQTDGLID